VIRAVHLLAQMDPLLTDKAVISVSRVNTFWQVQVLASAVTRESFLMVGLLSVPSVPQALTKPILVKQSAQDLAQINRPTLTLEQV